MKALVMVLMGSQLNDYSTVSAEQRKRCIRGWMDEVKAVRGEASILWHPHMLSEDYGWRVGCDVPLESAGST